MWAYICVQPMNNKFKTRSISVDVSNGRVPKKTDSVVKIRTEQSGRVCTLLYIDWLYLIKEATQYKVINFKRGRSRETDVLLYYSHNLFRLNVFRRISAIYQISAHVLRMPICPLGAVCSFHVFLNRWIFYLAISSTGKIFALGYVRIHTVLPADSEYREHELNRIL